ncbi:MAG: hypothetical protein IGS49_17420 [Chlorogloeopsis fritschii C42_A2020_084]|nr:hypothetical protein [Chlorogloeopsis fritschii]MBF2007190.1 hypothetical protein [Chlorogloeopsis fritschii C42_A2020_084]
MEKNLNNVKGAGYRGLGSGKKMRGQGDAGTRGIMIHVLAPVPCHLSPVP